MFWSIYDNKILVGGGLFCFSCTLHFIFFHSGPNTKLGIMNGKIALAFSELCKRYSICIIY